MSVASIKPVFVTFNVNSTESPTETSVTFAVLVTFKTTGRTSTVSLSLTRVLFSLELTVTLFVRFPVSTVRTSIHKLTDLPAVILEIIHSTPLGEIVISTLAPSASITSALVQTKPTGNKSTTFTEVALPSPILSTTIV